MSAAAVTPSDFETWAERIDLPKSLRAPLRMVYCDRRTPTWAARECGLAPSTVLRAKEKYPFGLCPCCKQTVQLL